MDWYLILAIAIPFLFVIGVVNNAIKDQCRLEKGKLQSYLQNKVARPATSYDDEDDDWGKKADQENNKDLKEENARPLSAVTKQHHQALGDTNAKNAADYFARYYKD